MPQEIRITRNAHDKYEVIVNHNNGTSSAVVEYDEISITIANLVLLLQFIFIAIYYYYSLLLLHFIKIITINYYYCNL
jgi:hypothetical protein